MPAITITSSSSAAVVFGCTAETGIIINSFTRTTSREKVELTNDQGDVVAVSFYKPMAAITIEGVANGLTTGLGLAAPGVALTINNTTSANGITSGSVWSTARLARKPAKPSPRSRSMPANTR